MFSVNIGCGVSRKRAHWDERLISTYLHNASPPLRTPLAVNCCDKFANFISCIMVNHVTTSVITIIRYNGLENNCLEVEGKNE